MDIMAQRKIRLFYILSTRTHDFMDRSRFLLLFIHEMPCFRGQIGTKQADRALCFSPRSLL